MKNSLSLLMAVPILMATDQLMGDEIIKMFDNLSVAVYREEPVASHEFILKKIAGLPLEQKKDFAKILNQVGNFKPETIFPLLPKKITSTKINLVKNSSGHREFVEAE
jgi:hypothetical protein